MFYKPMLCKTFDEAKHGFIWDSYYVLESKCDGFRCQIENGVFRSRTGKQFDIRFLVPDGIFDGELMVNPHLGIQEGHAEVSHWLAHDHDKLVLVLFDCLEWDGVDHVRNGTSWVKRRNDLERAFSALRNAPQVWMSQLVWDDKKAVYNKLVDDGKEGAVFKNVDSPYVPGSRATNWVKMKAWDSVDVVITDCAAEPTEWRVRPGQIDKQTGLISVEGVHAENWGSYVGLSYGYYDPNSKLVRVGSTGQTGPKDAMERFVGMVGAYKSYGRVNETGALNHPVFLEWRDDKLPTDCRFDFSEGVML